MKALIIVALAAFAGQIYANEVIQFATPTPTPISPAYVSPGPFGELHAWNDLRRGYNRSNRCRVRFARHSAFWSANPFQFLTASVETLVQPLYLPITAQTNILSPMVQEVHVNAQHGILDPHASPLYSQAMTNLDAQMVAIPVCAPQTAFLKEALRNYIGYQIIATR